MWRNQKPSSTALCRPVRFKYIKETAAVLREEEAFIKNSELVPTVYNSVNIYHKLEITMIDGKVATALSTATNSSMVCSICGCKPSEMNDLATVLELCKKAETSGNLDYGLSTLHAWIRSMEFFLHLSYRLDIEKWRAAGDQAKQSVQEKKASVQKDLLSELNLVVDVPRTGGSGTSNDGNTARKFFQAHDTSATVLGVDHELVKRLYIILATLSSTGDINPDAFEAYCLETAERYVGLYPWYFMAQSIHKILFHGHQVIRRMDLPVGMFSEEAQEASNKIYKQFRENFTRKCSREQTNIDLMRRLLCSSDPVINTFRRNSTKKKIKELPAEALSLLK